MKRVTQGITKTDAQFAAMPKNIDLMKVYAQSILEWCGMPESEPARQRAWAKAARAAQILEDLATDLGEYEMR